MLIWPDGSAVECPNTFAETQALLAERGTGLAQIKTRLALIAERDDINAGAARVLMHVQALRHALARGDAAQAAWWTLRFGCEALMLEQECKGWPQAIAAGMGTSRGGHIGGRATRDRRPGQGRHQGTSRGTGPPPSWPERGWSRRRTARWRMCWPEARAERSGTVRDWLKGHKIWRLKLTLTNRSGELKDSVTHRTGDQMATNLETDLTGDPAAVLDIDFDTLLTPAEAGKILKRHPDARQLACCRQGPALGEADRAQGVLPQGRLKDWIAAHVQCSERGRAA